MEIKNDEWCKGQNPIIIYDFPPSIKPADIRGYGLAQGAAQEGTQFRPGDGDGSQEYSSGQCSLEKGDRVLSHNLNLLGLQCQIVMGQV